MKQNKATILILVSLCLKFQIYPGPDSENAIMSSVVFCIHHKLGCIWSGELRKLKVGSAGSQLPRYNLTNPFVSSSSQMCIRPT